MKGRPIMSHFVLRPLRTAAWNVQHEAIREAAWNREYPRRVAEEQAGAPDAQQPHAPQADADVAPVGETLPEHLANFHAMVDVLEASTRAYLNAINKMLAACGRPLEIQNAAGGM